MRAEWFDVSWPARVLAKNSCVTSRDVSWLDLQSQEPRREKLEIWKRREMREAEEDD